MTVYACIYFKREIIKEYIVELNEIKSINVCIRFKKKKKAHTNKF